MSVLGVDEMQRRYRLYFLLGALALAACADARSGADVTRFHNGYAPQPEIVTIKPLDPGLATSIEFAGYAEQLGTQLAKLGLKPAAAGQSTTLVAEFGYTTSIVSRASSSKPTASVGVGLGGGDGTFGVGGNINFPLGNGYARDSINGLRASTITLRLYRPATGDQKPLPLWEGRATTSGLADSSTSALAAVVPVLIETLLRNFPGESGKTVHYDAAAKK